MTFREALANEKSWQKRALIINLYHIQKSLRNKNWTMRDTAKRLELSLGTISESIKIAKAILEDPSLELLTRSECLMRVKDEHKNNKS